MREQKRGIHMRSGCKRGNWLVLLLVPILFLLQFTSVSAKENTEELPEALADALWEYITEAYEESELFQTVGELHIWNLSDMEEAEEKISFHADIIYDVDWTVDSAYDDWYMRGIFEELGIQGSDVKDMSEEELAQYLTSVGYEEEAEDLAGFIIGQVALRQPIYEQDTASSTNLETGEGAQGVYVEAEYTNGEYVITLVQNWLAISQDTEEYSDFSVGLDTAEGLMEQGKEQLETLFPDLERVEPSVEESDKATADVLAQSSVDGAEEEDNGIGSMIYVILIVGVVVVCAVVGVIVVRRKKK